MLQSSPRRATELRVVKSWTAVDGNQLYAMADASPTTYCGIRVTSSPPATPQATGLRLGHPRTGLLRLTQVLSSQSVISFTEITQVVPVERLFIFFRPATRISYPPLCSQSVRVTLGNFPRGLPLLGIFRGNFPDLARVN